MNEERLHPDRWPKLPRWLIPSQCLHCGNAIVQPVEGRSRLFCDDRCRINDWRARHAKTRRPHWCKRCRGLDHSDVARRPHSTSFVTDLEPSNEAAPASSVASQDLAGNETRRSGEKRNSRSRAR